MSIRIKLITSLAIAGFMITGSALAARPARAPAGRAAVRAPAGRAVVRTPATTVVAPRRAVRPVAPAVIYKNNQDKNNSSSSSN
ncbi:MAG: hypothetical protein P1U40_01400 [Coxiellaceae bacterium]|nr:hypothetical protein [Coxiellaceae bacterium]